MRTGPPVVLISITVPASKILVKCMIESSRQSSELGTSIIPIFLIKTQEERLGQTSSYMVQWEFERMHISL